MNREEPGRAHRRAAPRRHGDNARGSSGKLPETKGAPNWRAREMKVIDRYVEKLNRGRYRTGEEAARACCRELNRLWRRTDWNNRPAYARTEIAVSIMLGIRKRAAGVTGPGNRWQPEETRAIERCVVGIRDGRYPGVAEAAHACRRELAGLRRRSQGKSRFIVRSPAAIGQRIGAAVRDAGLPTRYAHRRPQEQRAVRRYLRAYRAGRYPSLRAAAAACNEYLSRSTGRPRPFSTIYWMLYTDARAAGLPKTTLPWSTAEKRVLNTYLRRLFDGRYRFANEAARDCHRALSGSRTYKAVRFALRTEAARVGLPRYHSRFTESEERLIKRYALKVHNGILPHWLAAAKQCLAEIQRHTIRRARTCPLRPRHPSGHTLGTVHMQILNFAHRQGLRGPRNPHWTPTEDKMAKSWVKWYDRYRNVLKLAPLKQAGEGLHFELAEKGFQRSISACRARVTLKWRQARMP